MSARTEQSSTEIQGEDPFYLLGHATCICVSTFLLAPPQSAAAGMQPPADLPAQNAPWRTATFTRHFQSQVRPSTAAGPLWLLSDCTNWKGAGQLRGGVWVQS